MSNLFPRAEKARSRPFHPLRNQSLPTVLGTESEVEFNELAELAAAVCSTPISLVSLFDETMQHHKGSAGCDLPSVPRGETFCEYTLRQEGIFTVYDARADSRFRNHALVAREPGIRFYAGVPVYAPSGEKAGALCVIDSVRRELKPWQARCLAILARQVNARIELRLRREEDAHALESAAQEDALFTTFAHGLPLPCYLKDKEHRLLFYNRAFAHAFGIDEREWLGRTSFELWPPDLASRLHAAEEKVFAAGQGSEISCELPGTATRSASSWLLHQRLCRTSTGDPLLAVFATKE